MKKADAADLEKRCQSAQQGALLTIPNIRDAISVAVSPANVCTLVTTSRSFNL